MPHEPNHQSLFTTDPDAYREHVARFGEGSATLVGHLGPGGESGALGNLPDDWSWNVQGAQDYEAWQIDRGERPPVVNEESFVGEDGRSYVTKYYEGGASETWLVDESGTLLQSQGYKTKEQNPGFAAPGSKWNPLADGSTPGDGASTLLTETDPDAVDFFDEPGTAQKWAMKHFPWAKDLNLGAMIEEAVTEGIHEDVLIAQIRDTPQYLATFPGITDEDGRMRFVNEQSYVDQVREYRDVLVEAGSIGGRQIFNAASENPMDYAALMERGISTEELKSRLTTYRDLTNNSGHVRAAFKIYANMDVSVEDLYQAVVDPEASKTLIGQYNQNLIDADFDYSKWVANATGAALESAAETLSNLQAQGALPEGAAARFAALSDDQAQGLVEALYLGDGESDRFLELDELIEAFQFALIGGAASEQGLVAPSAERVSAFREAGITRAQALKSYGAFANQSSLISSMISRTNVQGENTAVFGQEQFEDALFLSRAEESDLLTRGRQAEGALARGRGGFATTSKGARLAQPGRAQGVRY